MAADNRRLSRLSIGVSGSSVSRQSLGAPRLSISGRRSSLKGGRPSLAPDPNRRLSTVGKPAPVTRVHDPRPIGDKAFTKANIAILIPFLVKNQYDRPISPKTLQSPSKKDYLYIVEFLVRQIDPNFTFGEKTCDEELILVFKQFGYPFAISKNALAAVGSPHTWPGLLAGIVWLIEYLTYCDQGQAIDEETSSDAAFCNYCQAAYVQFLEGSDNFSALDKELAAKFAERNRSVELENARFQQSNETLQSEIQSLENSEGYLQNLQSNRVHLTSDREKLVEYLDQLKRHQANQAKKIQDREEELASLKEQLAACEQEHGSLQSQLDRQELSPAEVRQMTHDRDMLQHGLQQLDQRKTEIQQSVWKLEMDMAKQQGEIETLVSDFNKLALATEIAPASAKYSGGRNFELAFQPHGTTHLEMVNLELKGVLKPALASLQQQLKDRVAQSTAELRALETKLKESEDMKSDLHDKNVSLQKKLAKFDQSYRETRDAMNLELKELVNKVEDGELSINTTKATQSQAVEASANRLAQLEQELQAMEEIQASERAAMCDLIKHTVNQVASHKAFVEDSLKALADHTHDQAETERCL